MGYTDDNLGHLRWEGSRTDAELVSNPHIPNRPTPVVIILSLDRLSDLFTLISSLGWDLKGCGLKSLTVRIRASSTPPEELASSERILSSLPHTQPHQRLMKTIPGELLIGKVNECQHSFCLPGWLSVSICQVSRLPQAPQIMSPPPETWGENLQYCAHCIQVGKL